MSTGEQWYVFYYLDWQELCACTVRGSFPGEIESTKDLLAAENGIDPAEITVRIENRLRSRKGVALWAGFT